MPDRLTWNTATSQMEMLSDPDGGGAGLTLSEINMGLSAGGADPITNLDISNGFLFEDNTLVPRLRVTGAGTTEWLDATGMVVISRIGTDGSAAFYDTDGLQIIELSAGDARLRFQNADGFVTGEWSPGNGDLSIGDPLNGPVVIQLYNEGDSGEVDVNDSDGIPRVVLHGDEGKATFSDATRDRAVLASDGSGLTLYDVAGGSYSFSETAIYARNSDDIVVVQETFDPVGELWGVSVVDPDTANVYGDIYVSGVAQESAVEWYNSAVVGQLLSRVKVGETESTFEQYEAGSPFASLLGQLILGPSNALTFMDSGDIPRVTLKDDGTGLTLYDVAGKLQGVVSEGGFNVPGATNAGSNPGDPGIRLSGVDADGIERTRLDLACLETGDTAELQTFDADGHQRNDISIYDTAIELNHKDADGFGRSRVLVGDVGAGEDAVELRSVDTDGFTVLASIFLNNGGVAIAGGGESLSFYGATPQPQGPAIPDQAVAVDVDDFNDLLTYLRARGDLATP